MMKPTDPTPSLVNHTAEWWTIEVLEVLGLPADHVGRAELRDRLAALYTEGWTEGYDTMEDWYEYQSQEDR